MEIIYIIILVLLCVIILLLSLSILFLIKKTNFLSEKEKEFILFTIDIFIEYADDLGIQTKEQHKKLVKELNKIKKKLFKN